MSNSKRSKHRGRPPKYVLDHEGKEVVGLSYNSTNGMYYVTSSSPRKYFKAGGRGGDSTKKENFGVRRDSAIQQFNQWKKISQLSPEYQEEQKLKDAIHNKAKELVNDGYMDDYVYERAYDLISDDPVEASIKLGIKNLIFLKDKNFYYPFTLDLVWELFKFHPYANDKQKFKRYEQAWIIFRKDVKTTTIKGITQERMNDWKQKLYQEYPYDDLIIELFECLDIIFTNVLKHNFRSESIREVIQLIHDLYNQIS